MKPIQVLVVDDSALMRRVISDIIKGAPGMELAATARDGLDALEKVKSRRPDVATMDLEMPRLDGLATLELIMKECPLPVIMLSSHTMAGSESTLKALSAGAVDFISKPSGSKLDESLEELNTLLPEKIIAAAAARIGVIEPARIEPSPLTPAKKAVAVRGTKPRVIVAIGASTGGPKVLESVFKTIPADLPATILLSQHMPPGFTASFAQRLNQISPLLVKEAEEKDALLAGRALIAPGGYHMVIKNGLVNLSSGPKVNYVRPSVDVMLESLAGCAEKILVVIMTGMGKDGAAGSAFLKKAKSDTLFLAQDPVTALIPSMPEAMLKSAPGAARMPADRIAAEIDRLVRIF